MTSGASHCVLFQKTSAVPPIYPLSLPNGRSHHYLNLFVCENTRAACSSNGAVVQLRQWQFLVSPWQETEHISHCWMQNGSLPPCDPGKSTERAFDLQHHGRCTHNRHHQHVWHHCAPAATKHTNKQHHEQWHCVQAHKYEQINNQHEQQYFQALHKLHHAPPSSVVNWLKNTDKGNWGTATWSPALSCRQEGHGNFPHKCQHLEHCFSDELTYSCLTSSWCQLWITKLHHRIA